MTAFNEALLNAQPGDIFESGKVLDFSDEQIVWVVDDVEPLEDGSLEYYIIGFYHDIEVTQETITVNREIP